MDFSQNHTWIEYVFWFLVTFPSNTQASFILHKLILKQLTEFHGWLSGQLIHEHGKLINCRIKYVHTTAILHPPDESMQFYKLSSFPYDVFKFQSIQFVLILLSESKWTLPLNKCVVEATRTYNCLLFFNLLRKYDISVCSTAFFIAATHTGITCVLNLNTIT